MAETERKIPATLTVLTKNSGKTLEKALESAKDFDDIIVCDGGSTDNTLDIARRFGANIISQDKALLENGKIFDYAGVRNQTFDAAKHNWIFWLDSDEFASYELVAAIQKDHCRARGDWRRSLLDKQKIRYRRRDNRLRRDVPEQANEILCKKVV
jgi:glycosyltransferase involved in cell wall biosynthesis